MMIPATIEELATLVNREGKTVFLFTADWCGDCRFLIPLLRLLVMTIWKLPKNGISMAFLAW